MKLGERGYTLIEVLISITIMALASSAAGGAIFQIMRNTERNADHMTVARQVQNAGDWISRDAQMSLGVSATANLTLPVFLVLRWTENVSSTQPIYHTANYTIENLSGGIGTLKRRHTSSAGANEQTLIAQYIYYNPADTANTSNASYESPILILKVTASVGGILETREYKISRRPNTSG